MKTLKNITTVATLSLILFLSSSIANSATLTTGDIVKTSAKKQISAAEAAISKITAAVETEFSYLRFDVNKFNIENVSAELPASPVDYLRFDVKSFSTANEIEITELPSNIEFEYLRFDVTDYEVLNSGDINEFPANEFEYLRFDVNNYSDSEYTDILSLM